MYITIENNFIVYKGVSPYFINSGMVPSPLYSGRHLQNFIKFLWASQRRPHTETFTNVNYVV